MRAVERFFTTASADHVWTILADVESWPSWTSTVVEIKPLSDAGLRVGARYRVTQPKLRPAVYDVTDCTPGVALTWVQRFPGGAMTADHRLVARNGGTEVELSFSSMGCSQTLLAGCFQN